MTQERFHRLLDNPDLLANIPYEELKTLALTYPYAHNLRYLLALKAKQDDHPDAERALTAAAVYSLDRRQLFLLAAPQLVPQSVSITMQEAILELKPIEAVQRELEALAPQSRVEETKKEVALETPNPPVESESPDEISTNPPISEVSKESEVLENQQQSKHTLSEPFAIWINRFNPPHLESKTTEPTPPPEKEKSLPALTALELAERSVAENKDVISETLARLLAKQGHRDKSINMYERLRLGFPEKSAYFAAEIEKLKK